MKVRLVWIGMVVLFIAGVLAVSSDAVLDPETIVGIWKFDEGKGNTTKDSSGNGNDGTLMEKPKWVDGKFGKALEFDGTSFVNMGNNVVLTHAETPAPAFLICSLAPVMLVDTEASLTT